MESAALPKPPWQLPFTAWQRRHTMPSWPAPSSLTFGPWTETHPCPELLAAKEKISPLEASKRWELIKKLVNPYEMVFTHEDPFFHPSLSVIKPLSRSYFKLVEMLDVLQFFEGLPKQSPKFRTAHVAEGPGGFLQAVAHLAERHKRTLQQATAMTLKPTDQYVPGWRRASSFLHHHKEVKLHFGADGTGDIYLPTNQDSFVAATAPGVHLFTADGGFDFSVDYTVQEQRVFRLLTCSASTGLRCLLPGGALVLKVFDTFSDSTRILLIVLSRCFKEWVLYKPALSRPCNSERYFLGRGFKGVSQAALDILGELQRGCEAGLYPTGAAVLGTAEELAYLDANQTASTQEQMAALDRAIFYAANPMAWYTGGQIERDFQTSLRWCSRFRIPTQCQHPKPITHPPSEYISPPVASLQSSSPGVVSDSPGPCDPA